MPLTLVHVVRSAARSVSVDGIHRQSPILSRVPFAANEKAAVSSGISDRAESRSQSMPSGGNLTNSITIIGRGVPSNYEISVDGAIEMINADPDRKAVIVSEQTAEGAIDTGVDRFRFSGENGKCAPRRLERHSCTGVTEHAGSQHRLQRACPERR